MANAKTTMILNPKAAAGRAAKSGGWPQKVEARFEDVKSVVTEFPGHATTLSREAVKAGADRIVVVGGDGTINEVVNGLFEAGVCLNPNVELMVLPAGTGSDFARSIGLDIERPFGEFSVRKIDVGRAVMTAPDDTAEVERYFLNISSFGSSGLIVDMVNRTTKKLGGKASFMIGTLRGLATYKNQRIRLQVDDTFDEEMLINTVAVANGRYFGGSMMVAPEASLSDGLFDIVIIGDINVATFVRHSGKLYRGEHLSLPDFRHLRGKRVVATPLGETPVLIDTDGEQPGILPVRYEILPQAISVNAPWAVAQAG